jgi:hypothetical protein
MIGFAAGRVEAVKNSSHPYDGMEGYASLKN